MMDPQASLYLRVGGYDAIAAFADDLLARLTKDPQLAVYWKGKCQDSMRKERQVLVDFLCSITGGPVNYSGRDMKTSHIGLGITESEWETFARHAVASLNDLGVREREKADILALAGSFKDDIVEVRSAAGAGR
jgi:hemoglobin